MKKKAPEAALGASEEQYRWIFNSTSDALILWGAQGKVVDVSPAAWETGGYTKEDFLSKPFHVHIHPASIYACEQFKSQVAKTKASTVEMRAIRKDSTVIDLESSSIPMPYRGQLHLLTVPKKLDRKGSSVSSQGPESLGNTYLTMMKSSSA